MSNTEKELIAKIKLIDDLLKKRKDADRLAKYNVGKKKHKKQIEFHKCKKEIVGYSVATVVVRRNVALLSVFIWLGVFTLTGRIERILSVGWCPYLERYKGTLRKEKFCPILTPCGWKILRWFRAKRKALNTG